MTTLALSVPQPKLIYTKQIKKVSISDITRTVTFTEQVDIFELSIPSIFGGIQEDKDIREVLDTVRWLVGISTITAKEFYKEAKSKFSSIKNKIKGWLS